MEDWKIRVKEECLRSLVPGVVAKKRVKRTRQAKVNHVTGFRAITLTITLTCLLKGTLRPAIATLEMLITAASPS